MKKDTVANIKSLTPREQARTKVAIWFGSASNYMHPLKEMVANSADELNNNFSSGKIHVKLMPDKRTVIVKDTGRGIPIADEFEGKMGYEQILETLFAGGNYDNEASGAITTGLNGVGLTASQFTSSYFKVSSDTSRYSTAIEYKNGGLKKKVFPKNAPKRATGTVIEFRLDPEVFTHVEYSDEDIREVCENIAITNPTLTVSFESSESVEFNYSYPTIREYFDLRFESLTSAPVEGSPLVVDRDSLELIFATSPEPKMMSFLNGNYMAEGGTLEEGVVNGLKLFINKHMRQNNLGDPKLGALSNADVASAFSLLVSLKTTAPEFSNQTKHSTNKPEYKQMAQQYVMEVIEAESAKNPVEFKKIVDHMIEIQKFNSKASASRNKLKKQLMEKVDTISNRVPGLVDCKKHGEHSELFIAEGLSALGSIVLSRDPQFQACLPIRGKITNIQKLSIEKALESETILNILKTLGCGVEANSKSKEFGEFSLDRLRYGKILIATDEDVDGQHIQILILGLLYRLTPSLIKQGRVYIVKTPLYEMKLKDGSEVYLGSEEEKIEWMEKNDPSTVKSISRAKGLGQLEAEVMAATGVKPETRKCTQVVYDEKAKAAIDKWLGTKVDDRKEDILKNLQYIID